MRNILVVLACAAALALGGCGAGVTLPGIGTIGASVTPTPGTPTPVASIDPTIEAIQNTAAKVCGFVPTVSTVAGIVTSFVGGGPIAGIVGSVATAICNAVVPKSSLRRGGPRMLNGTPVVNGVPVEGYFLR